MYYMALFLFTNLGLTSGFFCIFSIDCLQVESTARNLRPSLGICCIISSEPKIGSRYSHCCWQLSHSSMISCQSTNRSINKHFTRTEEGLSSRAIVLHTSHQRWRRVTWSCTWTIFKRFSQTLTRSSKGPINGLALIDWVFTIWSSSSICVSSSAFRMHVPVSRHSEYSNFTPCHSLAILSSVLSKEYSLLAYSDTSSRIWFGLIGGGRERKAYIHTYGDVKWYWSIYLSSKSSRECRFLSSSPSSFSKNRNPTLTFILSWRLSCTALAKLNESSGRRSKPSSLLSFFQWRSRSPGFLKAMIKGRCSLKMASLSFSCWATVSAFPCVPDQQPSPKRKKG